MYKYTQKDQEIMAKHGLRCIPYYPDKIAWAKLNGYNSYLDFVMETDAKTKSCRKTAEIVGMTAECIRSLLKRLGIKPRPPGGANNKWGRRGKA